MYQSTEVSRASALVKPNNKFWCSDGHGDAPKECMRSQLNVSFAKQYDYLVLDNVSNYSCIYLFLNCKNILRVPSRPKCYTIFTTCSYTHQFHPARLILIKLSCPEIPWFPWNHPLRSNLSKYINLCWALHTNKLTLHQVKEKSAFQSQRPTVSELPTLSLKSTDF